MGRGVMGESASRGAAPADRPGMERMHNRMQLLTAEQVERIYRITDQLDLPRDWVVVPLTAADESLEMLHPDGKLLLRAPAGDQFEPWMRTLAERLQELDLGRIPRREEQDPKWPLTGPGEVHA